MEASTKSRFYEVFAQHLTAWMTREKIGITDLVRISGEQNKTIKGMIDGRRFTAHHFSWITKHTDIDLKKITEELQIGGDKEETNKKENVISTWI